MDFSHLIEPCQDGTIKYQNPFSGTRCWYTPGRKHRPNYTDYRHQPKPIPKQDPPGYCAFCPARYWETTPEKSRITYDGTKWLLKDSPEPEDIFSTMAHFRRIGNLYEIVSMDYWKGNYGYKLLSKNQKMRDKYLHSRMGRNHVLSLIDAKLQHMEPRRLEAISLEDKLRMADSFFGGAHELIIPWQHYSQNAQNDSELFSTGDMTIEEHFQYIKLTIHSIADIYENNPFVQFVSTYTNWRRDAGATFEHLHRQIIGLDIWGDSLQRAIALTREQPDVFQYYIEFLARRQNLFICENEHAIAVADIGQPFSTVAIFSRQRKRPHELSEIEIRGVSDIVHAIHAALGPLEPCNEEWYYRPPNADALIPWYILIKWRKNRHAGIEGITRLYVDVFRPEDIRDMLIDKLRQKQQKGQIASMTIGRK